MAFILLLVAELFKILFMQINDCGHKVAWKYLSRLFIELKLSTVVTLITKFHDMSTVTFPWQQKGIQTLSTQTGKSEFSSFKKCYLLLLFIQWVWANMDIAEHKHKKVC